MYLQSNQRYGGSFYARAVLLLITIFSLYPGGVLVAQTIIGGATPDNSSMLDVQSTGKGVLFPRMTTAQRDEITSPATSLMLFNTTTVCLEINLGTPDSPSWEPIVCPGTPDVTNSCSTTAIVDVTNPTTGKTWMDRNLGASRAATSVDDAEAYGSLFQWGRSADGHECVNRYDGDGVTTSETTEIQSDSDTPEHGDFILNEDWRSTPNADLWQGVNGTNNPCPQGYRVPTEAEWDEEIASWESQDIAGAFSSVLKLPTGGYRDYEGDFYGLFGASVWSSSVNENDARSLYISSNGVTRYDDYRGGGNSVRCIKD